MNELMLFTDGSVDVKSNIGYGAYISLFKYEIFQASLGKRVKVRRFEQTSSTKLELQTLLWALSDIQTLSKRVIVYTDCQNIIGLEGRRERFEKNDYLSNGKRRLNNYKLYQKFFKVTDLLDCEFIKVRGHQPSNQKDNIDRLFTVVDKASRNALRDNNR